MSKTALCIGGPFDGMRKDVDPKAQRMYYRRQKTPPVSCRAWLPELGSGAMTVKVEIICDGCGSDISYTQNSVGWRLALVNQRLPIDPAVQAVTDMMIYRAIQEDAHFCGLQCLSEWLARKELRKFVSWNYRYLKDFAP